MGCDIHATLEFYDGIRYIGWLSFARDIHIDRNYRLFHYLGEMYRGDENDPVIAKPRGIPKDAGYKYKEEVEDWGVDGHTHSYLTAKEFDGIHPDDKDNPWYKVVELLVSFYGDEQVRLCYFFDN